MRSFVAFVARTKSGILCTGDRNPDFVRATVVLDPAALRGDDTE